MRSSNYFECDGRQIECSDYVKDHKGCFDNPIDAVLKIKSKVVSTSQILSILTGVQPTKRDSTFIAIKEKLNKRNIEYIKDAPESPCAICGYYHNA